MRRSFAPSQKSRTLQSSSTSTASGSLSRWRGTSHILELLNSGSQECSPIDGEDSCPVKDEFAANSQCSDSNQVPNKQPIESQTDSSQETVTGTPANKRYFNVVYGKQSKKKHKTWEGDGILEVANNAVVLKDTEGKILGRASGKKFSNIEEGTQFYVGSKEVEILDEISSDSVPFSMQQPLKSKENDSKESCAPPKKKQKIEKFEKMFSCPVKSRPVVDGSNVLMMPRPDHDHQWKFNTENSERRDVFVEERLASKLRPHQKEGVTFLYRCVVGLRNSEYLGAILADEMGLGKTLQTITLVWTLMKQGPYGVALLKRVLIVTPSSLLGNWNQEFRRWLGSDRINVYVVDQKNKFVDYDKQPWTPVIIMSYEMFVRCHSDVCRYKFDLVICDEGHRLKNNAIKASTLLNNIDCKRRIILTGTPIQNNLQEFHALVDFVNPSVLGTYAEFRSTFEAPIVAARQPDTASDVIRKGEQCAEELNLKTSGFILRRTQELINKYLPTKHEAVVFCKPTAKQKLLYEAAVDFWEKRLENDCAQSPVSHLSVLIALKKISNHPFLIYNDDDGDDSPEESKNDVSKHLTSILESSGGATENDSSKLNVLAALLENLRNTKERIVVVSYYKQTLDLIAAFCAQKQFTFSRLDGSTPATQRTSIIDKFNSTSCRDSVFLLSGKAGGTGLNLVGASRLVLFDSDWNPASDQQAMARIWRDGQSRSVHIYRLLTTGSIEEKIFQRQLSKASLGETVVDFVASNSTVRLSNKELKDLFKVHESNCFTHDLMECSCNGDGNVIPVDEKENSGLKEEEEEKDASQLNLKAAHKATNANLKMNQLFHWQHHSSPFSSTLLKEMGLEMADTFISFVFRNTTS